MEASGHVAVTQYKDTETLGDIGNKDRFWEPDSHTIQLLIDFGGVVTCHIAHAVI